MFYSKYKRKNSIYVLKVFDVLCVESPVRFRGIYLHTYLWLLGSRLCQELGDRFSCCIKNLKEDLKLLSGVSKSQVEVLVVAVDQRKKWSMDSELSHGRGSKFSTRSSNRMLVL